jgi:hypothetical protein
VNEISLNAHYYLIFKFNKMNKILALALIGVGKAPTPGPLPSSSTFPKFATTPGPSNAEKSTNNVLKAYSQSGTTVSGPYRAYRNDLYVFLTQTLSSVTATDQTVIAAASDTRSFYVFSVAKLGAYPNGTDATKSNVA